MTRRFASRAALLLLALLPAVPALALYDPAPDKALAALQGNWRGTLTYRDYTSPDRMVTLPTRLAVALAAPTDLTLHFVYDDGPGKTVYSYERMQFDFARSELRWTTGSTQPTTRAYRIVSDRSAGDARELVVERPSDSGRDRYVLQLAADRFEAIKTEISAAGDETFRNRYIYSRP
jgi:hypothetical protein